MTPQITPDAIPDPVALRIRLRRQGLGYSLQKLARLVGIRAASHIHHIEKGEKIPSEDVASRLAQALHDDPALYLAWVRARQRGDLAAAQQAVRELDRLLGYTESVETNPRLAESIAMAQARMDDTAPSARVIAAPRISSPPPESPWVLPAAARPLSLSQALPALIERMPEHLAERMRTEAAAWTSQAPAPLIRIPILPEGVDPDLATVPVGQTPDILRLDPRALVTAEQLVRPFAYRLTESGVRRVRHVFRAGDLAIVTRNAWPLQADPAYAVRSGGRVVLTRVLWKDGSLSLLPATGDSDLEVLEPSGTPPVALLGRVLAVFRGNP